MFFVWILRCFFTQLSVSVSISNSLYNVYLGYHMANKNANKRWVITHPLLNVLIRLYSSNAVCALFSPFDESWHCCIYAKKKHRLNCVGQNTLSGLKMLLSTYSLHNATGRNSTSHLPFNVHIGGARHYFYPHQCPNGQNRTANAKELGTPGFWHAY